jgi:hypothetical protein
MGRDLGDAHYTIGAGDQIFASPKSAMPDWSFVMGRPRTPASVLQLRGGFLKHPERRREDPPGAAPFEREPPAHLPQGVVPAWRHVAERLPMIAISSSDEIAVEQAARVLAALWQLERDLGPLACRTPEFKRLDASLLQWLGHLGMSPRARAGLVPVVSNRKPNPFADLKEMT